MSGRKLKPDELELWAKVTQTTKALPKAFDPTPVSTAKRTEAVKRPVPDLREQRFKLNGSTAQRPNNLAPSLSESMAATPVAMDRKAFRRMQRGKLKPDARIDLHGMTLDRAHNALSRFVLSSHGSGKRLLLVITGKGKHRDSDGPIPVRLGVLRHQVPEWLRLPPLAQVVLQITPAHLSHGGGGAYYVYLRKSR